MKKLITNYFNHTELIMLLTFFLVMIIILTYSYKINFDKKFSGMIIKRDTTHCIIYDTIPVARFDSVIIRDTVYVQYPPIKFHIEVRGNDTIIYYENPKVGK